MALFSGRLSILVYHRVVPEPDALEPGHISAPEFDAQMAALRRWCNVLPLKDAAHCLREGKLPPRAACVTFDDGYADNATVALPILLARGVPATFFVASGFLDGGRMWNDSVIEAVRGATTGTLDARKLGLGTITATSIEERRAAVRRLLDALRYLAQEELERRVDELCAAANVPCGPSDLMMTTAQVRRLHECGMEVGAHTVTHPILARLDPQRAGAEIREGRRALQEIIGAPVRLFAYPNGKPGADYGPQHVQMVREAGYEAAVSTAVGVAHAASDRYQLPRLTPWPRTPGRFLLRLLHSASFRTRAERV